MTGHSTIASLAVLLPLASTGSAVGQDQLTDSSTDPELNPAAVEEITVTAQKREDRLQDIPITVTVLTASNLDQLNLSTSTEIAAQVPSLEIKSAFGASEVLCQVSVELGTYEPGMPNPEGPDGQGSRGRARRPPRPAWPRAASDRDRYCRGEPASPRTPHSRSGRLPQG